MEGNGGGGPGVLVKCLVRWLFAGSSCHLHSTDTPEFWEEEDDDDTGGSASVSMTAAVSELEDGEEEEEDEEEEAATVPEEERQDMVMDSDKVGRGRQNTVDSWGGTYFLVKF